MFDEDASDRRTGLVFVWLSDWKRREANEGVWWWWWCGLEVVRMQADEITRADGWPAGGLRLVASNGLEVRVGMERVAAWAFSVTDRFVSM